MPDNTQCAGSASLTVVLSTAATSPHPHRTAIIAGSVIGGVVSFTLVLLIMFYFSRRTAQARARSGAFDRDMMVRTSPGSVSSASNLLHSFKQDKETPTRYSDLKIGSASTTRPAGNVQIKSPMSESDFIPYGYDSDGMKSFRFPSITGPATMLHFTPLTDRQMELQERVYDLQSKLIHLMDGGDVVEYQELKRKIERLKDLERSDWALGKTDEAPPDLIA